MRIFSSKICPVAYFATKLARLSCPIAFHANCNTIFLDSLLRTSVKETLLTVHIDASKMKFYFCELFLTVPFPAHLKKNWEPLGGTAVPTKKSKAGWLAACLDLASCFCLVRAIKPNIDRVTLPLLTTRLGSLLARCLCAHTMGLFLESSGSRSQLSFVWRSG